MQRELQISQSEMRPHVERLHQLRRYLPAPVCGLTSYHCADPADASVPKLGNCGHRNPGRDPVLRVAEVKKMRIFLTGSTALPTFTKQRSG